MMKAIVNYHSQTGFTKRYARWIAEKSGADLIHEKMSKASKLMMKMFLQTLKAKKDKTEEEQIMIKMISSSYDISDIKYIKPILECLYEK